MKFKLLFVGLLFSLSCISQADKNDIDTKNTFLDIGVGLGPNYGIVGIKTVIGKNGTGLMIGLGKFDGYTTFSISFQAKYKWWFANLGYGSFGSFEFSGLIQEKGLLNGFIMLTGAQISLIQNKKLFLELAAGYHGASDVVLPITGQLVDSGGPSLGIGLGYRIGK